MTKMFKPKINSSTPARLPDPAPLEAPKQKLGGEDEDKLDRRKRGRSALRIDPQTGGVAKTGTGLNIPMK